MRRCLLSACIGGGNLRLCAPNVNWTPSENAFRFLDHVAALVAFQRSADFGLGVVFADQRFGILRHQSVGSNDVKGLAPVPGFLDRKTAGSCRISDIDITPEYSRPELKFPLPLGSNRRQLLRGRDPMEPQCGDS